MVTSLKIPGNVPAAKLTIGNKTSIELDTTSVNGKKTIKLMIMSEDDTIEKTMDDVISGLQTKLENAQNDIENDVDEHRAEIAYEQEAKHHDRNIDMIENMAGMALPIVITAIVFTYLAFRSFQNRKLKEAMLNKGISLEEITKFSSSNKIMKMGDGIENYEKKKMLKYAIVLGSFGLALVIGSELGFSYFLGFLCLFLSTGLYYYYHKIV